MNKRVLVLTIMAVTTSMQAADAQKQLKQRVQLTDRSKEEAKQGYLYEVQQPVRVRGVDDQPPKGLVTRILECFGYGQTGQGQPEGPVYARRVLRSSRVKKIEDIEDEEILRRLKAAQYFLESFQSAAAASAERIKEGGES